MTTERSGSPDRVTVDIQEIGSKGFDGAETALTVITMLVSGTAGGLTAAVGEDIWRKVRDLVQKRTKGKRKWLDRKRNEEVSGRTVIVVELESGTRLSCSVESERDVAVFADVVRSLEIGNGKAQESAGHHWRYDIPNKTWREIER